MSTNSNSKQTDWESFQSAIRTFYNVCTAGFWIIYFLCYSFEKNILKNIFGKLGISPFPEIEPSWIFGVFIIIALFITVPILFQTLPRSKEIKEVDKLVSSLAESVDKSINVSANLEKFRRGQSFIATKDILYDKFKEARAVLQSKKGGTIYMTNFLVRLDDDKSINYYKDEVKYCQDYKDVEVRKIITIHDKTKLNIYKKIVEDAHKQRSKGKGFCLRNLHIAYLRVPNFELSTWFPEVIGVQILANDRVILMNPRVARLTTTQADLTPLSIHEAVINESEDSNFVKFFKDYHTKIWEKIKESEGEYGFILYDGEKGNLTTNEMWKTIEKQMDDIHDWKKPDKKT